MQEINLGALTASLQKGNLTQEPENMTKAGNEPKEQSPVSMIESSVDDNGASEDSVITARVLLTPNNQRMLDLYRYSKPEKYWSRSQLVNEIIEDFLNSHVQEISENIKILLDSRT